MATLNKRGRGGSYVLGADNIRRLVQGTDQQPDPPEKQQVPDKQPKLKAEKAESHNDTNGGDE